MKWLRGSSFEDSLDPVSVTSQRDPFGHNGDPEEQVNKHSIQHLAESGRETPVSRNSASNKSHYYADDSEMPAWKIYAKDLFLYGGSGLWRSASLKGSDPVLLMQDESINRSRSQLRTGSLSGISYHFTPEFLIGASFSISSISVAMNDGRWFPVAFDPLVNEACLAKKVSTRSVVSSVIIIATLEVGTASYVRKKYWTWLTDSEAADGRNGIPEEWTVGGGGGECTEL